MTTTDATDATPAADTMLVQALVDLQHGGRVIRQGTEFAIERRGFRPRQMVEVTNESPARALDTFARPPVVPSGGVVVNVIDAVAKPANLSDKPPVLPSAALVADMEARAKGAPSS